MNANSHVAEFVVAAESGAGRGMLAQIADINTAATEGLLTDAMARSSPRPPLDVQQGECMQGVLAQIADTNTAAMDESDDVLSDVGAQQDADGPVGVGSVRQRLDDQQFLHRSHGQAISERQALSPGEFQALLATPEWQTILERGRIVRFEVNARAEVRMLSCAMDNWMATGHPDPTVVDPTSVWNLEAAVDAELFSDTSSSTSSDTTDRDSLPGLTDQ